MEILVAVSASKEPEVGKVYLLREKQQINRRGRLVSSWKTHENAVRVTAIRGNKVMIKNAFGNQQNAKARGIELRSIGTGKTYRFLPYEKNGKQSPEVKDLNPSEKLLKRTRLKELTDQQKQLKKQLDNVTKEIEKLKHS